MKAVNYQGAFKVKVEDVPMPKIEHPDDVVVKVTTSGELVKLLPIRSKTRLGALVADLSSNSHLRLGSPHGVLRPIDSWKLADLGTV